MITVDLAQVEALARQVAQRLGKTFEARTYRTPSAANLIISNLTISATNDAARLTITTIEPGTLFLELPSGAQAEWLVKDEQHWLKTSEQLQIIFEAAFTGSVIEHVRHCFGGFTKSRATLQADGQTIQLVRHGKPLPCLGAVSVTQYAPFPDG